MKTLYRVVIIVLFSRAAAFAGAEAPSSTVLSSRVVERGQHYKTIETVRQAADRLGHVTVNTNRYTTLGNGINFKGADGNWIESRPVIQGFPGGVVCTGASYRVSIANNINTAGAIDLETRDGERIVSHPLAIGFFDPDSGRSVLLAQVKDCPAEVTSNKVVFRDAFEGSGIKAAIVYAYDAGRFHQDVIFVRQPSVTPARFQMGDRTRLEIMTEVLQSPAPTVTSHVLKRQTNPRGRAAMAEPDVVDQTLKFGAMTMPLGRAFGTDAANLRRGLPVAKQLLNVQGRRVLIESLDWNEAMPELEKLPAGSASASPKNGAASSTRQLPERRVAQIPRSFKTRLAELTRSHPSTLALNSHASAFDLPRGFAVDYEVVESIDDFTFTTGTYYLPNAVYMHNCGFYSYDQIILKYNYWASLNLSGSLYMYPSFKILCTAKDDDEVGDIIEDSTGDPQNNYYAAYALSLESLYDETVNFLELEFRHVYGGLHVDNTFSYVNTDVSRFSDSALGVDAGAVAQISLGEVHACNVGTLYLEDTPSTVVFSSVSDCNGDDGDYDNDGLPDAWEITYFHNLSATANGDPDGDGWANLQEYSRGTNPKDVYNSMHGLTAQNGLMVFTPLY